MISKTELLNIISGQRKDLGAILVRMVLGTLTPIYRLAVGWRNYQFDKRPDRSRSVSVPVISVGNLTTGGTGKTPMVVWIAKQLRRHNLRVAIVSRGYGSHHTGQGRNDEALELEDRLPDVPHLQDPDRWKAATIAVEELESEVIVVDDGFQHRQLARDLNIVLIDATNPFGFGRLLPRGLLREPVSSLRRADAIVVTRADFVDQPAKQAIRDRVRRANSEALWAECRPVVKHLLQADGNELPLARLANKPVAAFCAIGNPEGFSRTLDELGMQVLRQTNFPDHHGFTREELKELGEQSQQLQAAAIVCTHKDLVKVGVNRLGGIPVFAVVIDTEFLVGEDQLKQLIELQGPSTD